MSFLTTDRRLHAEGWRSRYRFARTSLAHLKLTLQTLNLPDEPEAERLPPDELEAFLKRLLADALRFARREGRLVEAVGPELRRWRVGELLPLLELFDDLSDLVPQALPAAVRDDWKRFSAVWIRLKASVVRWQVWSRL